MPGEEEKEEEKEEEEEEGEEDVVTTNYTAALPIYCLVNIVIIYLLKL